MKVLTSNIRLSEIRDILENREKNNFHLVNYILWLFW